MFFLSWYLTWQISLLSLIEKTGSLFVRDHTEMTELLGLLVKCAYFGQVNCSEARSLSPSSLNKILKDQILMQVETRSFQTAAEQ